MQVKKKTNNRRTEQTKIFQRLRTTLNLNCDLELLYTGNDSFLKCLSSIFDNSMSIMATILDRQ